MTLKKILKTLEKDYGWSFYDENKELHLTEMQKQLILDVMKVVNNFSSNPVLNANAKGYKEKYDKCIKVIKKFDAGIIGMYDL